MLDQYHSAEDASRILGVHPETVKRLCRSGELNASKFHNNWLIHSDELGSFKENYNPKPGRRPADDSNLQGLSS
jgi:excisionase family DNA binding protein